MDARRWVEPIPAHQVSHEGEIVVVTIEGVTFRLRMDEASRVARGYLELAERLRDAIARAGGIEPQSGGPIWKPPARRRKKSPPA